MNKKELVNNLAEKTGLKKYEVRKTIDAFIEEIEEQIRANEKVNLKRLGVFSPVLKSSRPVRNPKTGDPYVLEEHYSVKFRPGDDLVRNLNKE